MRKRVPEPIPGDPSDPHGFPALIAEFCEQLSVHAYSPLTVKAKRTMLAMLARWLAERSVTRPAEVTLPMLEGYQRALFHARKEDEAANRAPDEEETQPRRIWLAIRRYAVADIHLKSCPTQQQFPRPPHRQPVEWVGEPAVERPGKDSNLQLLA